MLGLKFDFDRIEFAKMKNFSLKFTPYFLWIVLFVLVPTAIIIFFATSNPGGKFTMENILKIANYKSVILKSLTFSTIITLICLVMAYPFAYFVSQFLKPATQKILIALITLPMWTNLLLRAYAFMAILENNGLLNKFLKLFGIEPIKIMNTPFAVILVMVYDFLPFMTLPIYEALSKIDKNLIEAGSDLGANQFQNLKSIILPLSLQGVFSGILIVFISSTCAFVIPRMFGGGSIVLVGDLIESQFLGSIYNPWFGSALALILMSLTALIVTISNKWFNKK